MKACFLVVVLLAVVALVSCKPVADCKEESQLLADDVDCTIFYECNFGRPIKFNCPAGEEYDPNELRCDYPKEGGCHAQENVTTVEETNVYEN